MATVTVTVDISADVAGSDSARLQKIVLARVQQAAGKASSALDLTDAAIEQSKTRAQAEADSLKTARPSVTGDPAN